MGFHVGQTFGDYSIVALAGAGGMSRVYKVEHLLTKRAEAMKVLSAELASETQIKRFEREMRALAKLTHPNIAALHNATHSEDQLILLMEFVEGTTLESLFGAGRLAVDTGIGYITQVLAALAYAHEQGVVHRDVTPSNVMVTPDGQAKLTDFGLSKSYGDSLLTNCGEVLGSLPYLAPEQLKGTTQPDRRSDLYSVGAILYEHLTGQKPFGEKRRLSAAITDSEPDPRPPSELEPSLAPEWDAILARALARNPAQRYQSADEFLHAIAQLEQPIVADLPLPQLRTLGIGVAIFAGLIVAVVASPMVGRLRGVSPIAPPWGRMHIGPPNFALAMVPRAPVQAASVAAPVHAARPAPVKRVVAREAPVSPQVVAAAPVITTAPATVPPLAPPPVGAKSAPEPVAEPEATVATSAPAKRRFWGKLNVFKRKSSEAAEGNR